MVETVYRQKNEKYGCRPEKIIRDPDPGPTQYYGSQTQVKNDYQGICSTKLNLSRSDKIPISGEY
jgi:hypothetical protein